MATKDQAEILRAARDELGLTAEEMAIRLGVSYGAYRNWLLPPDSTGRRNMPQTAVLLLGYVLAEHRREKKSAKRPNGKTRK